MSSEERMPERPLRDVKGLLKFCIEATRNEDASTDVIVESMTKERKEWLEAALKDMTVSPAERMSVCIKAIREVEPDTESGTEQQVAAVTELQDWAEDIDLAADFIKMNGLSIIPPLLSSEVSELRWRCLELVANLSQNNPFAQKAIVKVKLMPALLSLAESDPNPTVQVKALYAVSCLVRSSQEAELDFLENSGMSSLMKALASDEEKLRIKASFLMTALCQSNPALRDVLVTGGVVESLVQLLQREPHSSNHEHVMGALVNVLTDHKEAKERCLRLELDFKSFLSERVVFLKGKEAFKEELDYANMLLQILNNSNQETGSHQPSSKSSQGSSALMLLQ